MRLQLLRPHGTRLFSRRYRENQIASQRSMPTAERGAEPGASSHRPFPSAAVQYLFLAVLFFFLLYMRRSIQLLHPQVWDEDGVVIIPGLLDHGLKSLFYPVNGYLILVPKLISAISLSISGIYYPLVSTIITWFFIIGVCIAIAKCPTWLKWRALAATATLLVPTDPEVIGIPLDTLWWASLLLLLVVLWDERSRDLKLRLGFVLLGGLSSAIIILVAPFLVFRAIVFKARREEKIVAASALFCCFWQAVAMLHSSGNLTPARIDRHSLHYVMPKFIGGYLAGNFNRTTHNLVWFATGVFVAFLLMTMPFVSRRPRYLSLFGLWIGLVCITARRVDLSILDLKNAGPRYFFLPFILMSWFLVVVISESERWDAKALASLLFLASVLNMLPVRSRLQKDFHWKEAVCGCDEFAEYSIPIAIEGGGSWNLNVDRRQCAALQRSGLINSRIACPAGRAPH